MSGSGISTRYRGDLFRAAVADVRVAKVKIIHRKIASAVAQRKGSTYGSPCPTWGVCGDVEGPARREGKRRDHQRWQFELGCELHGEGV